MTPITEFENDQSQIVVGVGASAGGLEAFQLFLKGLPDKHNLAIVLVQHLDPDHESLMPELVAARTSSPVHSVTNNMKVTPGHIYLIPPGYEMEISGDELTLQKFESPRGLRRPIDRFFTSLAKSYGENAIAVILSGTGSDGAEGAREVKGQGGLVFAQDTGQAKYDGMPHSVISLGCADAVVNAEEVVDVIRDYFSLRVGMEPDLVDDDTFVERIMRHVRFRTGHDFADYKQATILRRIAVRMSVLNLTAPSEYLKHIVQQKEEADYLFQNLLVNVTSFFRDPEYFEYLRNDVIPEIVEDIPEEGEIRVWCAGCSTGEEAYSLGILFLEEIERTNTRCRVIIFATDIDDQALNVARTGRYPDSIARVVPEAYLDQYFKTTGAGYSVGPELREIVRFSRHSFIKDPPFSKLHFMSCRNVLIYMKENLQEVSAKVFHYGLLPGQFLFLGSSENPKSLGLYFEETSSRCRVFRRRPGPARPLNLGALSGATKLPIVSKSDQARSTVPPTDLDRVLHEKHLPAHIHVSQNGELLYSSPKVTRYLRVRPGKTSLGIFDFIIPELETVLRRLMRLAEGHDRSIESEWQGEIEGNKTRLLITVEHLPDGTILIVLLDSLEAFDRDGIDRTTSGGISEEYLRGLEVELDEAKQAIRTTVEELETSNEELKSSNEEMMSMNEELQSANEELTTINDELQQKVQALNQANLDLYNFTRSARTATVFLDEDLRLRSFTPEAEEYFRFVSDDVGRPMSDLHSTLDKEKLLSLCAKTIADNDEREVEFLTSDNMSSVAARIMPYSPEGKGTRGVVFTLVDVTELRNAVKEAEQQRALAEASLEEIEQIYRNSPVAMCLIDENMRYVRLNEQLAAMNGAPLDMHHGRTVREIIPAVADATETYVKQVLETGKPIRNERVIGFAQSEPDVIHTWECDWQPYYNRDGIVGVNVSIRDITEELETSARLRQVLQELEHRVKNMLANVSAIINRAEYDAVGDEAVYRTLKERIFALSNTHALLTAEEWSSASLQEIISPETVNVYGPERVKISGPDLRVNAETTLALGLAIHEMATNASKHGAFLSDDGVVYISWAHVNDSKNDRLVIKWLESNGPVPEKPKSLGFGSTLIHSAIEGTLRGVCDVEWLPEGVQYTIELDFQKVSQIVES